MRSVHPHNPRLNLLLSWVSWRDDSPADRLPTLLEPLGITSIRARSARQAEQVIRTTPVHFAVVDLGLPLSDNPPPDAPPAGTRVLELLRRLESPPPTVIVKGPRSLREERRHVHAALNADAFAVIDRAGADLEILLRILQRAMHRFYQGQWPADKPPPTHPETQRP